MTELFGIPPMSYGDQKPVPDLSPKDFARIQRNINVDWMNLCLKLMRSKKKPLGESTWEPTVYSLDSELKASSFDRAIEEALKAGR